MDVLAQFFKDIMARTMDGTGVVHFAWFNDQPEDEDNQDPYPTPAVFMAVEVDEARSVGRRVQWRDVQFRLYVETEVMQELDSREDAAVLNAGLAHTERYQAVFAKLHGWGLGTYFGSVSRMGTVADHSHDNIMAHSMLFKCQIKDTAARKATVTQAAPGAKVVK